MPLPILRPRPPMQTGNQGDWPPSRLTEPGPRRALDRPPTAASTAIGPLPPSLPASMTVVYEYGHRQAHAPPCRAGRRYHVHAEVMYGSSANAGRRYQPIDSSGALAPAPR